jgi:hypothetical protein
MGGLQYVVVHNNWTVLPEPVGPTLHPTADNITSHFDQNHNIYEIWKMKRKMHELA